MIFNIVICGNARVNTFGVLVILDVCGDSILPLLFTPNGTLSPVHRRDLLRETTLPPPGRQYMTVTVEVA